MYFKFIPNLIHLICNLSNFFILLNIFLNTYHLLTNVKLKILKDDLNLTKLYIFQDDLYIIHAIQYMNYF